MSRLEFDGMKHEITLYNAKEEVVGTWEAYNHIDSKIKMRYLPDRTYIIQDKSISHMHPNHPEWDTSDGKFGPYGIVRFFVPGHDGVGVHSGRKHAPYQPGAIHATEGCIRTIDEAMQAIHDLMQFDELTTITVFNNLPKKTIHSTKGAK